MAYWIHRIGRGTDNLYALHFDALRELLFCDNKDKIGDKNCLTIGWQCLIDDPAVVASVESNDKKHIKSDIKHNRYYDKNWAVECIENFADMTVGDIVIVLLIFEYEPHYLITEIKSAHACSIINVPVSMQSEFTSNILYPDGRTIYFDPIDGFKYKNHIINNDHIVEAGFFHEVDILNILPRTQMSPLLKTLCDKVLKTNAPIKQIHCQQYIYDNLIPSSFKTRIKRP
ncbi:MAG: hypothetical protein IJ797_11775 [Selenomonadaceae bacterium]|nr:hypothetical protein [Selenomonadaceae bacterium]